MLVGQEEIHLNFIVLNNLFQTENCKGWCNRPSIFSLSSTEIINYDKIKPSCTYLILFHDDCKINFAYVVKKVQSNGNRDKLLVFKTYLNSA